MHKEFVSHWLTDWERRVILVAICFELCNMIIDLHLLPQFVVHRFYDSVSLEVYAGWAKGSSVYTQVFFIKVAYTFWHMNFEVTVSSGCWCNVLGSYLCTGYNDLSVPIDWLNLIKYEWMVDSVVLEVQWLFDSIVQWLFYVRGFSDWLIQRLMFWF